MISIKDFIKIKEFLWEIPKGFRPNMLVPARIYTSQEQLETVLKDRSINQLLNVACLPGIQKYALAMPDIHEGYSSPIGGVAAIDTRNGIISPGMCGYDINCGIKFIKTSVTDLEIKDYLEKIADKIQQEVPSGLGRGRKLKLNNAEMKDVLEKGITFLLEKGYATDNDVQNCESYGRLDWANSEYVSRYAKDRGRDQLGTLGSGNHFIEIQKVQEIYDDKIAKEFGLFKNQVGIMIHCGSRGLGHQVCSDYLREFIPLMEKKYKIDVPDREFACVPFSSPEGQRYFSAMAAAANYAWANRQFITYFIRKSWNYVFGNSEGLTVLYDVAHNIIKKETYEIENKKIEVAVHRKGSTRAFPPGSNDIPPQYRNTGQPVIIPGSMGTSSYILVGSKDGFESWYSTCHGAGRAMSRKEATRRTSGQEVIKKLKSKGIIVKCWSLRGIAEEAPIAYKDIDSVINVVDKANLSRKVAKLIPLAVIKGE
jgi:tRNA-splicing ligase RtcB